MDGRINVAGGPEIMVSRRSAQSVEKANPAWIPRPNSPLEKTHHKTGIIGDPGGIPASRAPIFVATERRGAAALDGFQQAQCINYLKVSGLHLALLIKFPTTQSGMAARGPQSLIRVNL